MVNAQKFSAVLTRCVMLFVFLYSTCLNAAEEKQTKPSISPATENDNGLLIHKVQSEYQAGITEIKVLLPDRIAKDVRYRVLYILPVEAANQNRYGDGLLEAKKHDIHNEHQLICVMPTFSHLPWYADHPDNPKIRQETYFLKVVLPFIEKNYPVQSGREGRLLVGFSKSGWGAWTLLLRHPELFSKAAAWDAPMQMQKPGRYGNMPIFATQENFDRYCVFKLLKKRAEQLKPQPRLILTGYGGFRDQHLAVHVLITEQKIPLIYLDGPKRKHIWESGWLPEIVDLMMKTHSGKE